MTPYTLSIAPVLEEFRPEIEHVVACLERWYALVRAPSAPRILHYGPNPPAGAIHVPNTLFPECVRINDDGIRLDRAAFAARDYLLVRPAGPRQGDALTYDAIGLAFLLLSGIEERDYAPLDRYARFPHGAAFAVRHTGGAPPLADQAVHDLAAALLDTANPPPRTSYAVMPTHDVDMLRGYHRWWEPLRYAAGDAVKRGNPARGWRRLSDAYLAGEPWRSVRYLMDHSEQRGLASRFFFMGPSADPMDSPYAAEDAPLLRRVADEVARRGHAIGFHPGFATASDRVSWHAHRKGLERAIGREVREGRQHVLRYAVDATPDIWDEAGMRLDMTLAWPEVTGFRTGSCRMHPAFSLRHRKTLALEQLSTAVMDFGLFGGKYRALSVEAALEDCAPAIGACRKFGGTFVVLMHTHQPHPPETVFYERLLDMAA